MRAHAGQHRVLHRAPEVGLGDQRGLHLQAPAHVAPGAEQHPDGERRQQHHHPEQAVADQADRGAVALAAQDEAVLGRRDRQLEDDRRPRRLRCPAASSPCWRASAIVRIEHRDRVPARDLGRHEVAQQPLDRILGDQRAVEDAVVDRAGSAPGRPGCRSCRRTAASRPSGACRARARRRSSGALPEFSTGSEAGVSMPLMPVSGGKLVPE